MNKNQTSFELVHSTLHPYSMTYTCQLIELSMNCVLINYLYLHINSRIEIQFNSKGSVLFSFKLHLTSPKLILKFMGDFFEITYLYEFFKKGTRGSFNNQCCVYKVGK